MKKILIVDDAAFMRKVTGDILSQKYEIITASSGEEALELYESQRPDLVLSDLVMPRMTGIDLQRSLSERYGQHVPFIFMTADERDDSESKGLEAGAMDYIHKPFKPEVLLRRVDNAMRQVENLRQIQGLKAVAETDPMTGLLNKAFAQKTLTELCRTEVGTLIMVDLDSFKLVNDLYGHAMGDRVLISFAEILRSVVRANDPVGRMGGDEFIIFCRDIHDENLIAEKSAAINAALLDSARELMGEDMNIPLGASVGAVAAPDEGTDFSVLYRKADKALYRVKQNGKHGCSFYHTAGTRTEPEAARPSGNLNSVRMILEERSRQSGAYQLGFESFRTVYRFLLRSMENYHYTAEFVLLSLPADAGDPAMERLGEVIHSTLRRSDVYTKSAPQQYMLLLCEVTGGTGDTVLQRLADHWKADKAFGAVPLTCEHEAIQIT